MLGDALLASQSDTMHLFLIELEANTFGNPQQVEESVNHPFARLTSTLIKIR